MARSPSMTCGDAVRLLGREQSGVVNALDLVLGLGLLVITGFRPDSALPYFDAKNELIAKLHRLATGLKGRLRSADRIEYDRLLTAAHAVIAMTALTEELTENLQALDADGEWSRELREWQSPSGGGPRRCQLVRWSEIAVIPPPGPARPFDVVIEELRAVYAKLGRDACAYLRGLHRWDELSETWQSRAEQALTSGAFVERVIFRYREHYVRLAGEVPEFFVWTLLNESAATRNALVIRDAETRERLTRVEAGLRANAAALGDLPVLLAELAERGADGSDEVRARVAQAHQIHQLVLRKPLLTPRLDGDLAQIRFPANGEGYINPDFRLLETSRSDEGRWLAQEETWQRQPVTSGLGGYLAAYLRSERSTRLPLLVLGDPGSGKSLLSKILAARLPPEEFAVARVELRHVRSSQEVGDQIDLELKRQTNNRYRLGDLTDEQGQITRVVIMDGLDELLQLSPHEGLGRYLEKLAEFQEIEAGLGRPVIAVATARTIVMDRIYVPTGTLAVKLEGFTDRQITSWIDVWNTENAGYYTESGLAPLSRDTLARHIDLARQPLLLALLALYDAEKNALRNAGELSQAELYERIFRRYLERELEKHKLPARKSEQDRVVEQRFRELSTIATGMLNRGRRFITRDEVDEDFTDVGVRRMSASGDSRIVQADDAVEQFFFLYRAQAQHHESTFYEGYEFIHSTLGEFLAARIIGRQLAQAADVVQRAQPWDQDAGKHAMSLLAPFLARRPLVGEEQVLTFLEDIVGDLVRRREAAAHAIARQVPALMESGIAIQDHRLERLAILTLNLVLITLRTAGRAVSLSTICDGEQEWRRLTTLWKTCLAIDDWDRVLASLTVRDGSLSCWPEGTHVDMSDVLTHVSPTSHLGRMIAEGRLTGDAELRAAASVWSLVRQSLVGLDYWDGPDVDWRIAFAAFRITPTGGGRSSLSSSDLEWALENATSGVDHRDLARLLMGGPSTWSNDLLNVLASYVAEHEELLISVPTLLVLITELDTRGLAAQARPLLKRLPYAREAVAPADIAAVVVLHRRHQLREHLARCIPIEDLDGKVLEWLGVEDLVWILQDGGFTPEQVTRFVNVIRSHPRCRRMLTAMRYLADLL